MEKIAGREKHNTTDKNYPPLNEPCKNSYLGLKRGEAVSVNRGHHLTGKCQEELHFPYSLNSRIKASHNKDIMERIRNAVKPGRQQIFCLCGGLENDPKIHPAKHGPDKTWKKMDIRNALKNGPGKPGKDDIKIIYKRHKRRNHAERIGESSKSCRRGLNVQWKKSLSEPRIVGYDHAEKKSLQETEPLLGIPSHFQSFAAKNESEPKETKKSKSQSNKKGLYRSKSSTDSRTESGRRLQLMADRKLNLHREMIRSRKTFKKDVSEPTHQGNENSLSSFYIKKILEGPDYSKQNFFPFKYQALEKPASWSQMGVKKKELSPPGYLYYRPKNHSLSMNKKRKEVKAVHRLNYELENPFSSKSTTPVEPYWKSAILKSSAQNETELDKLSIIGMSLLNSTVSSQTEELMYKLPKHMKQYHEFIKKINKAKKADHKENKFIRGSKSDSKVASRNKSRKTDSEMGFKDAADLVFVYSFWQKLFKKSKKDSVHHKYSSHKERKHKKKSENNVKILSQNFSGSIEHPTGCSSSTNSHRQKKEGCRNKKHKRKSVKCFCCDAYTDLQKRVILLEKEVEQIRNRISCYDPRNIAKEALEICVKSPKENKQHQCTNHHHHYDHDECLASKWQQQRQHHHVSHNQEQLQQQSAMEIACYPFKTTSSETIVSNTKNRSLVLKSSTSDCHLNVGMEIKMENVDPSTGNKLGGEVRRNFQQDGNIQCRLFEEGHAPLLVLDTDFQYNPLTGMLFKNQKSPSTTPQSANIILPLKATKEPDMLTVNSEKSFSKPQNIYQAFECTQKLTKESLGEKPDSRKCISLEQNSLNVVDAEQCSFVKSKRTQSLESASKRKETTQKFREKGFQTDLRLGEKESRTTAKLEEKFVENELPQRSGSSSARRKPKSGKSFIPTRKKPTPSVMGRSTSGTSSLLSLAVSNKSSMHESFSNASSKQSNPEKLRKINLVSEKTFCENRENTDNVNQTAAKKARKIYKDEETQTDMDQLKNTAAQTLEKITKEASVKTSGSSLLITEQNCRMNDNFPRKRLSAETVNVAIQSDQKQNSAMSLDVGLQTNILSQEAQKYLKDLHIQKKVNLAIAELCFHLANTKQKLAKLFSFTWTFGFFLCKWVHYMQSVSAICSVLTLTAMSLERYYAIVHPMKAQYICTISQARRIITGTWVSAFLLAVPILFAQVHLKVGIKVEAYWCVRDWDNKIVWRAHELYMFLLILIVPTGVMAVAYTAICWEIWEVMQRRQDLTSGKEKGFCKKPVRNPSTESFPSFIYTNNQSRLGNKRKSKALLKKELADDASSVKQVIKMLVAVLVIYVLCWGPMLTDNVLQAYGILSHIRMGWMKYMGTAFHLMAYFNSCINPIIYGFMSKNFRDSFRKTLCCMGRKQKMALRSFSLSQTRNTSIRYAESSFGRAVSITLPV